MKQSKIAVYAASLILVLPSLGFASQTSNKDPFIEAALSMPYGTYGESRYSKKIAVTTWDSPEGIKRFERTKFKQDFYRLAHHFKPQKEAACGQASATIVLSAIYQINKKSFPLLRETPIDINCQTYAFKYALWNEENFFNETTDKILDRRAISRQKAHKDGTFAGGIDIEPLKKMLEVHGVSSKLVYTSEYNEKAVSEFRKTVKRVVNSDKEFLILNYDHGYKGSIGAHFSPVVAYDSESDSVLMLDVAAHTGPWIWISLPDLYRAMNTKNYTQTNYRGYLLISSKLS